MYICSIYKAAPLYMYTWHTKLIFEWNVIAFFIPLNNVPVPYELWFAQLLWRKAMIFLPRTNYNRIVQTDNTVYIYMKAYKFRRKVGPSNHWWTFWHAPKNPCIWIWIFTPRVSSGCNSFDIVCVWVCVLPLSKTNRQTYGPEIQHVGQVEGYLGQVQRSR